MDIKEIMELNSNIMEVKMIIREIKTNKLYDTVYSEVYDKYLLLDGTAIIRELKPAEFRYLLYDIENEYIVEKDDLK